MLVRLVDGASSTGIEPELEASLSKLSHSGPRVRSRNFENTVFLNAFSHTPFLFVLADDTSEALERLINGIPATPRGRFILLGNHGAAEFLTPRALIVVLRSYGLN